MVSALPHWPDPAAGLVVERWRAMFDSADVAVALVGLDGVVLHLNAATLGLLGVPEERVAGARVEQLISPADLPSVRVAFAELVGGSSETFQLTARLRPPDGDEVWVRMTAALVRDDVGAPLHVIALLDDLDARSRAEALLARRLRFDDLVRNISTSFISVPADHVDAAIGEALARVGRFLQVDRSYVFSVEDGNVLRNTHEWVAEGIAPSRQAWQGYVADPQGWWLRTLRAGHPLHIDDLAEVPPDASAAAALLSTTGVRSLLVIPMRTHDELVGFVGFDAVASPRRWDDDAVQLLGAIADIFVHVLVRQRAEEALRRSEERYRTVVEGVNEVIFQADLDGRLTFVNGAWTTITGFAREWALGRRLVELLHPEERERGERLSAALNSADAGVQRHEARYRTADGGYRWLEVIARPVTDEAGAVSARFGTMTDVTERREAELQLAHHAAHDPLTGLPNRLLLLDRLALALERSGRDGTGAAVLLLDLDRFKIVNDSLGHDTGDALLVKVAARLRSALRPGDTVARLGGDEFVVVREGLDDEREALALAEAVQASLGNPFRLAGDEVFLAASMGIVLGRGGGDRPERLLRDADAAMYSAKAAGGGRYEVFDEAMRARVVHQLSLERDLRRAIERRELALHYQPEVDVSGRIIGVEALVRWQHPVHGLLEPREFVALAEETGLIVPVGTWILEEACRQAVVWRDDLHAPSPVVMSVNLSARQLAQPDVAETVAAVLRATGLPPELLTLEITETVLMEDAPSVVETLQRLKGLGVALCVDDFGTGYSSLSYLKRFPVSALKVDRSFVDGVGSDPEDTAIVTAVVGLAKALGLSTVAEGVETPAQLTAVRELGCDLAQGFHVARPQPADALTRHLRLHEALRRSRIVS